jgi:CheY-like chemotaxis protein
MALSILRIDSHETRAKALEEKRSQSGFARVTHVQGADLPEGVKRAKPGLIIVDVAPPDRDTLEDIRAVSSSKPASDVCWHRRIRLCPRSYRGRRLLLQSVGRGFSGGTTEHGLIESAVSAAAMWRSNLRQTARYSWKVE